MVIAIRMKHRSGSSGAQVLDAHVHSLMDWKSLNYTYAPGSIFDHDWNYNDYQKAIRPSPLPATEFVFMSLQGVPESQHLQQCVLAQAQAKAIEQASLSPRMVGIVATADLSPGAQYGEKLDALLKAVPLVVGVRARQEEWNDAALAALRELESRGLALDFLLPSQESLGSIYAVAKAVPNLTMIVDHMGLLGIPGAPVPNFQWWAREMSRLAALPNVYVKVSGGGAPSPLDAKAAMRPFVEHVVREFGYKRCVYNGNWYVVNLQDGFYSYRAWAEAVVEYLDALDATSEERDWLLFRAGRAAYRIDTRSS